MDKKKPCTKCQIRKWYAKKFDLHFSGEDCPYVCEPYETWKAEQKEGDQDG